MGKNPSTIVNHFEQLFAAQIDWLREGVAKEGGLNRTINANDLNNLLEDFVVLTIDSLEVSLTELSLDDACDAVSDMEAAA